MWTFCSKINSWQIHSNCSISPTSSAYCVPGTSPRYCRTTRTATTMRHVETLVLMPARAQQLLHNGHQMRELRTKRKSIPPKAAITFHFSIGNPSTLLPWIYEDYYQNKSEQPIHERHDESFFQTSTCYLHVQDTLYVKSEHLSWSLRCPILHPYLPSEGQQTAIYMQMYNVCLRILRR